LATQVIKRCAAILGRGKNGLFIEGWCRYSILKKGS